MKKSISDMKYWPELVRRRPECCAVAAAINSLSLFLPSRVAKALTNPRVLLLFIKLLVEFRTLQRAFVFVCKVNRSNDLYPT